MTICDVNVLVYAHRSDSERHEVALRFVEGQMGSGAPFGWSPLVASGFIRIVTHPGIFKVPSSVGAALSFIEALAERPNAVRVDPGQRHWEIFLSLCRSASCNGNLVPDAYLAAIALESGSAWATFDADFRRFEGLTVMTPGTADRLG